MRIQLAQGVGLTVIPTTQFKTTRIAVHFLAPLQKADVAARTLLTSVLETASRKYPTQSELSAYLEGLFGASFGIGVGKEGRMHRVTASMNLLSDQLAQADLLKQGLAFLKEVLLQPLMVNGRFDEAIFTREQHNLKQYLESLQEDRQTQASLGLQALYFQGDPSQAIPSFGTPDGLAKVTAKHLVAVYQQMLAQDRIEIVVLGNVDEAAVQQLAADFDFAPRHVDEAAFVAIVGPSGCGKTTLLIGQVFEIRAKCRRLKQKVGLKLVVIDYLQLMTSGKRVESRQQEVSEFSRALKLLAKELQVPVIALSQLNRGPEQRTDKMPALSDLRESGSLE